jgi:hypothetical protein
MGASESGHQRRAEPATGVALKNAPSDAAGSWRPAWTSLSLVTSCGRGSRSTRSISSIPTYPRLADGASRCLTGSVVAPAAGRRRRRRAPPWIPPKKSSPSYSKGIGGIEVEELVGCVAARQLLWPGYRVFRLVRAVRHGPTLEARPGIGASRCPPSATRRRKATCGGS